MFCPKCGANISDKNVFCDKCGVKTSNWEAVNNVNNEQNKENDSYIHNTQETVKLKGNNRTEDKNKIKKIAIICTIAVVVIVAGGIGIYQYNKFRTYTNLIATANKDMERGEYDQAIALFNQSLQYKNDANVQNKLKVATNLKEIKAAFDEGIKLMNDRKYLEAIYYFQKITKEDYNLYNNAQNNIKQCYIQLTDGAIKSGKYDEGNKYLDEVFKLDANNADAKKLRDDIAAAKKGEVKQNQNEVKQNQNIVDNTTIVIICDQPRPDVYYGNFIFWNSDRVYLTESQVYSLSNYQLGIARNEIYARRGYVFSLEKYRTYFGAQSWYTPISKNVTLNSVEEYNVGLIKAEEDRRGVVN